MTGRAPTILFRLSRTRLGGLIVRWSFANATRLMPVERVDETDLVIAFRHPVPTHPVHVLIVPKKPIRALTTLTSEHDPVLAEIFQVAMRIVGDLGLEEPGYSLTVNGGPRQDVPQLHFHLTSGEPLAPASPT